MIDQSGLVFDRRVVRHHRARSATMSDQPSAEFLFDQAATDMAERLVVINRRFQTALVSTARRGSMAKALRETGFDGRIFQADLCPSMLAQANSQATDGGAFVCDEEFLPFAPHTLDLILSPLSLHWLNDLPGALIQMQQALRPDGLFMGSLFGGQTLTELRHVLLEVEADLMGGASARISPIIDLRDAAGLLQRAGFNLPVADADVVEVTYESALDLLRDLRSMGETNALLRRSRRILPRAFWPTVVERYANRFAGLDGRIRATFEIFTLTGWHPHQDQQKPLRPGSATTRLADRLGTIETPTGEKSQN
ncbi:MAG: methyltransferase domain-containing protein [Pseudomonadota bacterium]